MNYGWITHTEIFHLNILLLRKYSKEEEVF